MARKYLGSSSVSSLLKSAQSAANKKLEYDDSIAAYNFQLSDKSESDYNAYRDYLIKRGTQVSDPSKQLSFTKAQDSAFKGFKSAEIQRASLAVNYGTGSLYNKMDTITRLMQQAASIGDDATYQTLDLQRTNLDIQIQNHENAGSGGGGGGGSSYETQGGVNAAKTFTDQTIIAKDLGRKLALGKISYSEYLNKIQYGQGILQQLSSKITAEHEARQGGGSTNDPDVSGLSESDLNALVEKADSEFTSDNYKSFSPEAMHRADVYGQQDFGVHYDNGVAERVKRPVLSTFNNPDGSVGNIYKQGDTGASGWFGFRDSAGQLVPTQVDLKDHDAAGAHTPYKSFMAPDGKGGFKEKIEMNVDTGRRDKDGKPIIKSIYVDPSKPGATEFLQDWAKNGSTKGLFASEDSKGNASKNASGKASFWDYVNPVSGAKFWAHKIGGDVDKSFHPNSDIRGLLQRNTLAMNDRAKAAAAQAAAVEAARQANYQNAVRQQMLKGVTKAPLPVKTPAMIAATTPSVKVSNQQVGINAQATLKVGGPGQKQGAPAPQQQHWYSPIANAAKKVASWF